MDGALDLALGDMAYSLYPPSMPGLVGRGGYTVPGTVSVLDRELSGASGDPTWEV